MAGRFTIVLWFRNDLRIKDNALLHHSVLKKKNACVVPFYSFDPTYDRPLSSQRLRFTNQCVNSLAKQVKNSFGMDLLVCNDRPETFFASIAAKTASDGVGGMVLCSEEVCDEELKAERRVAAALKAHGGGDWTLERVWNYSLYHPDDLPFDIRRGELPEGFSTMRKSIENSRATIRGPLAVPKRLPRPPIDLLRWFGTLPNIQSLPLPVSAELPPSRFVGGEEKGLEQLEHFCDNGLATYKNTRNDSVGWNYSSKLSPWLAQGCISPRQVAARVRAFEEAHGGETVHTYWVIFELMWRDYMRWFAWKHGNKIFFEHGTLGRLLGDLQWRGDGRVLEDWKTGQTGVPWVDAHMRELLSTGFMSNRGRQNVASFLVHELRVDWRRGAEYFEQHLIDHDVTANWCNWLHAAGVAKGSRVNRFNMGKQAQQYDPMAKHAKLWIPEIERVPASIVHSLADPKARKAAARHCPMYPPPVVPPPSWGSFGTSKKGRRNARDRSKKGRPHRGRNNVFHTS